MLLLRVGDGAEYIGGCKDFVSYENDLNVNMSCMTQCELGSIGRDVMLNFRWEMNTDFSLMALLTVNNKKLGWPAAKDRYIGILRLDKSHCGEDLLTAIEHRGKFIIDVGDKTNSNHWLESISYPNKVGEKWQKTALFLQFRKGEYVNKELITSNELKDQLRCSYLVSLTVSKIINYKKIVDKTADFFAYSLII